MNNNHARFSAAQVETIAGLAAGTASTLAVHPLDVIKTRLQIHRNISSSPIDSFTVLRSLLRSERPVHALYRGLTPNIVGNASSWAFFFYFKSILETELRLFHSHGTFQSPFRSQITRSTEGPRSSQSPHVDLTPLDYFIASGASGLLTTFFTNPIWVIKTRMLSSDAGTVGAYPSMWFGARDVWSKEGWRGFYRGLGVSCLGVSHGAVQFAVYEPLKNSWQRYVGQTKTTTSVAGETEGNKLGNDATLVISTAAKIIAGTVTYPYQVVRSRLQTYDAEERFGKGITGVTSKIWREDGVRGFYKGLGPNIVKVLPATWVTFLVYENMRYYMPRLATGFDQDL